MHTGSSEHQAYMQSEGVFAYTCHQCSHCCSGKRIWVNPYEVYRLSRHVGLSTTSFIQQYTVNGGTELAVRDDLSCVFLGERGCDVHADRPLVCRLYPLGRMVQTGAPDQYFQVTPHPESAGVFSDAGTVAGYLEQQGAAPYLEAADTYFALLGRILYTLREVAEYEATIANSSMEAEALEVMDGPAEDPISRWLDIDAALALSHDGTDPSIASDATGLSAEEALSRHVAVLEQWHDEVRQALVDGISQAIPQT